MAYSKVVTLDNLNTVYKDIRERYDNIEAFYDVRGNITWDALMGLSKAKKGDVYTISDIGGTGRPSSIKQYDNVVCIRKITSAIAPSAWASYWKEIGGIVAEATPKESGLVTARDQQIGGKKTFVKADVSVEGESGPAEIQVGADSGPAAGIVDIKEGSSSTEPEISIIKDDFKTIITSNNITVGSQKGTTSTGKLTISSGDVKAGNSNNKNYLGTLKVGTIKPDGSIQDGTGITEVNTLHIKNNDLEIKGNTIANNANIGTLTVNNTATVKTLNAEGAIAADKTYNMLIKDNGSLEATTANVNTLNATSANVGVLNVKGSADVNVTTFSGSTLNVTKGIQATYAETPKLNATTEINVSEINPVNPTTNPSKCILNVATKLDVKGTATFNGNLTVTGDSNVGTLSSTGSTTNINKLNVNSNDFNANGTLTGNGSLGVLTNTTGTTGIKSLNLNSIHNFNANGDLTGNGSLGILTNITGTSNVANLDLNNKTFTADGNLTGKGSLGTINNTASDKIILDGKIVIPADFTLTSEGDLTVSSGSTIGTLNATEASFNRINTSKSGTLKCNNIEIISPGSKTSISNTLSASNIYVNNVNESATPNNTALLKSNEIDVTAKNSKVVISDYLKASNIYVKNVNDATNNTASLKSEDITATKLNSTNITVNTEASIGTLTATNAYLSSINASTDAKGTLNTGTINLGTGSVTKSLYLNNSEITSDANFNVGTHEITAKTFNGNLNGNAETATKWATARTITLSGNVSGSVTGVDGSGNITISNTVVKPNSHNHMSSNITDLNATIVSTKVNNATTADKLSIATSVGTANRPVYFTAKGVPETITSLDLTNAISGAKPTHGTVTAGAFIISSSRKFKENIHPTVFNGLDIIDNSEVVDFNYIADANKDPKVGLIAEDCPAILAVPDKTGLDTNNCIGILIKAVQELNAEVKDLKMQLAELKR